MSKCHLCGTEMIFAGMYHYKCVKCKKYFDGWRKLEGQEGEDS